MAKKAKQELDKHARVRLSFTGEVDALLAITADAYEKGATRVVFDRPEDSDEASLVVVLEGTANHIVSVAYDLNRHHH
jgi:hypothetical protein